MQVMRAQHRFTLVVAMALALAASGPWRASSRAATHYVAKDGTGQFTVIQDALDAAAPGDTIRIGAGRYDEFREYAPPVADAAVIMHVQVSGLTIMGAGSDSVTVGPEQGIHEINGRPTVGMLVLDGVGGTRLSGVTIERTQWGVSLYQAARLSSMTIRFASNAMVALVDTDGAEIEDCEFEWTLENGQVSGITSFVGSQVSNTIVRRCRFAGESGTGVQLDGGNESVIDSCTFIGVNVGLLLLRSTGVSISSCAISGALNVALGVDYFSQANILECTIESTAHRGLMVSGSAVQIERTSISGGDLGAVWFAGGVDAVMRDCDILNSDGPHVYSRASSEFTTQIDLRHNFWGSTDSVEIAGWIDDGADDGPGDCTLSYCPRDTVQFWPVLERSVENSPRSTGSLKAGFRRRN